MSDSDLVDEALLSFVMTPAMGADHLTVTAAGAIGDLTIQDRAAAEARRIPTELAISIATCCERYAATERRTVRFRAAWQRGEKTLATYAWECGSGEPDRPLDGSTQSFLIDQQANARELHKIQIESFEMVQASWKTCNEMQRTLIEQLTSENRELRERLRKLDDVQTELAIEQMRADLEQRSRTTDLIEKRVLPIAQAFAIRKLEENSAAAVGSDEPKQSDNKQPSA